ncbi:MAG: selenium cofactor biosynthesis protein YqeC [Acidobacteria bacterium]|nr:selenium cofactor biosynthesis protein YqeC [Acidobacteriota bacterium]
MFAEIFSFRDHSLVNFVGGGGKTALIHRLLDEYSTRGPVLAAATTRIHPPDPREGLALISSDNPALLKRAIENIAGNCAKHSFRIVVSRHFMSFNLVRGVPPDFFEDIDRSLYPVFLNEADGAAGFSLKLPRENEPVPAAGAEYIVPVIGLDCIGRELGTDTILRWRELSESFSLRKGDLITPEIAAGILMHPRGVCKNLCPETTVIPFINKVDSEAQDSIALELADAILNNGAFHAERVIYGSVLNGRAFSVSREK